MGTNLSLPLCGNTEATVSAKPGVAESSGGWFPFVVQILFCKMYRSTWLHFIMPSSCPRVANSFQALLQHSVLMCQASSPLGYSFVSFLGHLAYRSSKQTERAGVGTKVFPGRLTSLSLAMVSRQRHSARRSLSQPSHEVPRLMNWLLAPSDGSFDFSAPGRSPFCMGNPLVSRPVLVLRCYGSCAFALIFTHS